jgi:hypothetical protein
MFICSIITLYETHMNNVCLSHLPNNLRKTEWTNICTFLVLQYCLLYNLSSNSILPLVSMTQSISILRFLNDYLCIHLIKHQFPAATPHFSHFVFARVSNTGIQDALIESPLVDNNYNINLNANSQHLLPYSTISTAIQQNDGVVTLL